MPADNVDYTRMTADGNPDDPGAAQAARIVKSMRGAPGLRHLHFWNDPQKLKTFTDGQARELDPDRPWKDLRSQQAMPTAGRKTQLEQDDEFWKSDEPHQYTRRRL